MEQNTDNNNEENQEEKLTENFDFFIFWKHFY